MTIAGVVADVRYAGLDKEPELEVYLPEALFPQSAITLLVKTTTNPSRLIADIRGRIARVDREAFVTDVRTMDQLIGDSLASRWFATMLLAVCAALGLLVVPQLSRSLHLRLHWRSESVWIRIVRAKSGQNLDAEGWPSGRWRWS